MLKIGDLRESLDLKTSELSKTITESDKSIKALSIELRTLKCEYEKTKSRELEVSINF